MDLAWLKAFREVARTGSLTAAAQALGFTQPAISRQINALEQATGARLLDRLPRGVRLTEEGRSLLTHAEAVLDRMDTALQDLEDLRDLAAGRLRAGAFDSANAHLVPSALAAFHAASPGIALSVLEGSTATLLGHLHSGRIDVAVISVYPHQTPDTESFTLHHLLDDPLLVALPSGHPLAQTGSGPLRLGELADERWVEGFSEAAQTLADASHRAGFQPHIDFTVRAWTAKQGYVAAGLGLALVPSLAATAVRPGIVLRPLHPDDVPVRGIHIATLAGITTPRSVTAFRSHLEAVVRSMASGIFQA